MSDYFLDPASCPWIHPLQGLRTRILTGLQEGDRMMMVLSYTEPGATVPLHTHPNDQFGMVYSGRALLRIGGEEREVRQGDFYRIPAEVPHGDTALGDEPFVMLDIFHPVRETFVTMAASAAPAGAERPVR
jgi:quercetin dioxygenase-like cupin family protein